jgi:hypothetical protein
MAAFLDDSFRGPVVVTGAYFIMYYSFMMLQLSTRSAASRRATARGEEFDKVTTRDLGAAMGERTFMNSLEQMGTFLVSLWACAACVSCDFATILGACAIVTRVMYPVLFSWGPEGRFSMWVELSTVPYLVCVLGMLGSAVIWGLTGFNVVEKCPTWSLPLVVVASFGAFFGPAHVLGKGLDCLTQGSYVDVGARETEPLLK